MRSHAIHPVASTVTHAVDALVTQGDRARRNAERRNPPVSPPNTAPRAVRHSKQEIDRWIPSHVRARVIALSAETGWQVDRLVALAVDLLVIQCRNPKARAELGRMTTPKG